MMLRPWLTGMVMAVSMTATAWAQGLDTDQDGWPDAVDSNPVSRVFIRWGDTNFTAGNEYFYPGPAWWLGAFKDGGAWRSNPPAWHVSADETNPASLVILLDRATLTTDVRLASAFFDHSNSQLYVDLADSNAAILTANLFGNLMTGSGVATQNLFSVPLEANPAAVAILLRRAVGEVTVYTNRLYVDLDGDGLDADQEAQLGTSDLLADSDGDGFSDLEEVQAGTNPTDPASYPACDISGVITYSGIQAGLIHVLAASSPGVWTSAWNYVISAPGDYTIVHLPRGRSWHIKAWRDSNTNGVRDTPEASGAWAGNPLLLDNGAVNVNILLTDTDTDGDGVPDYLETLYGTDPSASNAFQRLPFTEGFETNTCANLGELNGQHGWRATPAGACLIVTNPVYSGIQALQLHTS